MSRQNWMIYVWHNSVLHTCVLAASSVVPGMDGAGEVTTAKRGRPLDDWGRAAGLSVSASSTSRTLLRLACLQYMTTMIMIAITTSAETTDTLMMSVRLGPLSGQREKQLNPDIFHKTFNILKYLMCIQFERSSNVLFIYLPAILWRVLAGSRLMENDEVSTAITLLSASVITSVLARMASRSVVRATSLLVSLADELDASSKVTMILPVNIR